jgi:hypothetical protein
MYLKWYNKELNVKDPTTGKQMQQKPINIWYPIIAGIIAWIVATCFLKNGNVTNNAFNPCKSYKLPQLSEPTGTLVCKEISIGDLDNTLSESSFLPDSFIALN